MKPVTTVPVPKLIQENCEKDPRGLYVPVIVLKEDNTFHFSVNDQRIVLRCIATKCCSICGTLLKNDVWFIGGPGSVFHKNGAIADLPVHKECGEYALQVCPYLAYSRYTAKADIDNLYNKIKDKTIRLENPTMDDDRVPVFCFVKASGYTIHLIHNILFKPDMPYEKIEYWYNGKKLSTEEGEQIVIENFKSKYTLEDLHNLKSNDIRTV